MTESANATGRHSSSIGPSELSLAPVVILARRVEGANVAAVQCPHDADAREHRWAVQFDHQHKRLDRSLPFGQGDFLLQASYVVGGVAKGDQHAATR
jgi:hypothetical protein